MKKNMVPAYLLLAVICGTAALNDAEWDKDNTRQPRHNPPPVASFLERLRTLRTRRSHGDLMLTGAAVQPQGSLLYVQPEEAEDIFRSHKSHVPRRRERRHVSPSIAMRGCHLGTCQTQNLASMLYHLGYNNAKDGSNKNTRDPLGYGRRRRSVPLLLTPRRTAWAQQLLAT